MCAKRGGIQNTSHCSYNDFTRDFPFSTCVDTRIIRRLRRVLLRNRRCRASLVETRARGKSRASWESSQPAAGGR